MRGEEVNWPGDVIVTGLAFFVRVTLGAMKAVFGEPVTTSWD